MNYHKDNGLLNMIRRTDPSSSNFTFNFQFAKLVNAEHPISTQIYSNFGNSYRSQLNFSNSLNINRFSV